MTTPDAADLESRFRWVSTAAVAVVAAAFAIGLLLHVLSPASALSARSLQVGLVALMLAPALRLLIAVAERARRGDWTFVLMTVVVAAELAVVMWRASQRL